MDATAAVTGADFEAFVEGNALALRRALVARFGVDIGAEVTAEALGYAWEHWAEVSTMANPVGYLYRVGQSRSRRHLRWRRSTATFPGAHPDVVAPAEHADLFTALGGLSEPQRVSVLLVHAHGWTYAEVAGLLDVPVTTVTNHVHRGMARLRTILEAPDV
jgi:DNA-directed RNA polymerase specialized sigma24 family protein